MNTLLSEKKDALVIATMHKTEINQGFLSSLPVSFLETFYLALIESPVSFCISAKEQDKVVGFISGVTDLSAFYRYFLHRYFFHSLVLLLPKMLSFSSLKKIVETLFYPAKEKELPPAELLTMAVSRDFQGKGIASQLFLQFIAEMKQRAVKKFRVMVGEELKPAIAFYEKNGFTFLQNITVHGGSASRVYIYDII